MTAAINKDGHARIIIMHPETIPLEAGYIFVDYFSSSRFFLHSGGGPYATTTAIRVQDRLVGTSN